MKQYFEREIARGVKLNEIKDRISNAAAAGMITMGDKAKLDALAMSKAKIGNEIDIEKTVIDLVERVRKLEAAMSVDPDEPTDVPEYVPGKWYYAGDKVTFESAVYECIAPEGVVCVWSPTEYPTYWQVVNA